MVRRTKAEAQATRARILDAAERLFQRQGVSRTSLQDIAQAADVTRGAVYWHFKGKAELFDAMLERVQLPMAAPLGEPGNVCSTLMRLREDLVGRLQRVATDSQVHRVYEIATQKVEYVDDLAAVRQRHRDTVEANRAAIGECLRRVGLPPSLAASHAIALHAVIAGLVHTWLLDPRRFDLVAEGARAVDTYLRGLAVQAPISSPAPTAARSSRPARSHA